ncbi:hypothetical protein L218DRAFT_989474 [Marasmius fiardii PR-910]|nr:hypothetical protein L218DRAFT_989474 [Marasmius fiardii PR-910]
MKVAEFDTRKQLTPSTESLQSIIASSPLSNLDSDSDMDAEGDPDPECVNVPMVVEDEVITTISCGVYSLADMDAEGDHDPEYLVSVPMVVDDEVATTTSCGVDLPENQTSDSEPIAEVSVLMDVDEETPKLSEPVMAIGNDLGEGSSSMGLDQLNDALLTLPLASASLELNVAPNLRTQILEHWHRYARYRKDMIESEKLWVEQHAGILIEWIAGQLKTTLSVVQAVVNSLGAPKKQRPLRLSEPREATVTTSTKRRTSRSLRTSAVSSDNQEASPVKKRPARTSKRLEATATTSTKRRRSRPLKPRVSSTPDALDVIDREEVVSSSKPILVDQEKNIDIGSIVASTNPTPPSAHAENDVHDGRNLSLEPIHVHFAGSDSAKDSTTPAPLTVPTPIGSNLEQDRFDVGTAGGIGTKNIAHCNDDHADWVLEQSSSETEYAGAIGAENAALEDSRASTATSSHILADQSPVGMEDVDDNAVPELLITEETRLLESPIPNHYALQSPNEAIVDNDHVPPFDSQIVPAHEPLPDFQYPGHNFLPPHVNENPNDLHADRISEQSFSEVGYTGGVENATLEDFPTNIVRSSHILTHQIPAVMREGVVNNSAPPEFPITNETCPFELHIPRHLVSMLSPDVAIVNDVQTPPFDSQIVPAHEPSADCQTEYNDHTLLPHGNENDSQDMQSNARLEAFVYILEAEAAMKNAGCPEEVQGHFNGLMDYCEALFRG